MKSVSVVTSATGVIEEESDYRPWGEEKVVAHTPADQHFKFNGKERDTETGFDEFGARLYSSAWSRWLTPDWSADPTPVPYAQMDNPQSLNLYEYALNNPTTLPDLDGHLTPLGSCCGGGQAPEAESLDQWLQEAREELQKMKDEAQGWASDSGQRIKNGVLHGGCGFPAVCKTNREREADQELNGAQSKLFLIAVAHLDPKQVATLTNAEAIALADALRNGQTQVTVGNTTLRLISKVAIVYKIPVPGISGKQGAKDVPGWAKGNRPRVGEDGKAFAKRLLDEKYGPGRYPKGANTEFSKIQKWGDRAFRNPADASE